MIKMKNIKAIFRRGPSQSSSKHETSSAHSTQDDLSRSSSASNLNSLDSRRTAAVIRSKKSLSKEKLERFNNDNENDTSGLSSNRSEEEVVTIDEATLREIEQLRYQLKDMAIEKSELTLELAENRSQLQLLKNEVIKLKTFQDQSNVHIQQLNEENVALRNRLRDVAHSPLSDNEKQMLLDSHRHSSAPASIATNVMDENATTGDVTACTTPEWDKYSSSNVSEVSVACLQDKINQMQETHYSTNEELQATLQELTDLQRQLTELQQDNERLLDEKNLMFDSLCRQTERLNNARTEVESLKQLLCIDKENASEQFESIVDREHKLVDLLKKGQQERETLLVKLDQLNNEVQELRTVNHSQVQTIEQLTERVRTLESGLDAKHAEHRQLDKELAIAKDLCNVRQIEIDRLTGLLENAKTKIGEIEQERALNDKSELDELLDNVRKEKDTLECEVANLKEQVAYSRNESEKLREQVSILQEECKVSRNNAKCTQAELEYKCELLTLEKNNLTDQLHQLQEAANELQVQAQCHIEDKRQLSSVLSETQRNLSETEKRNADLENEIEELKRIRREENEEWEKFQNDLLTSVRVANDFKSEAQQELQKMIMENKSHRERVRMLEAQIDKLKGATTNQEDISSIKNDDDLVISPPPPSFSDNVDSNNTIFEKTASFIKSLKENPHFHKKKIPIDNKKDDDKINRRCSADELLMTTRTVYDSNNELKKSKSYDTNLNDIIPENELLKQKKQKKKFNFFKKTSPKNLAISLPTVNSVLLNPKLAAYMSNSNNSRSESELSQTNPPETTEQNPLLHWVFFDSDLNLKTLSKTENSFRSTFIVLHQTSILFEYELEPYIRIIHDSREEFPYYYQAIIYPSCSFILQEIGEVKFITPSIIYMKEIEMERQEENVTTISLSLNEGLRSKLTDEEYEIIAKLQCDPGFKRPISDINDDDLELIEYAKERYFSNLETKDGDHEPIYENFISLSAKGSHRGMCEGIKKPPVPIPRSIYTLKSDNDEQTVDKNASTSIVDKNYEHTIDSDALTSTVDKNDEHTIDSDALTSIIDENDEQTIDSDALTSIADKNDEQTIDSDALTSIIDENDEQTVDSDALTSTVDKNDEQTIDSDALTSIADKNDEQTIDSNASTSIIADKNDQKEEDALEAYLERKKSEIRRDNSRKFNVQFRNSKTSLNLNNRQSFEKAKSMFENISRK